MPILLNIRNRQKCKTLTRYEDGWDIKIINPFDDNVNDDMISLNVSVQMSQNLYKHIAKSNFYNNHIKWLIPAMLKSNDPYSTS